MIIFSPNKVNQIYFQLNENGEPFYKVYHRDELVIEESKMGFEFKFYGHRNVKIA